MEGCSTVMEDRRGGRHRGGGQPSSAHPVGGRRAHHGRPPAARRRRAKTAPARTRPRPDAARDVVESGRCPRAPPTAGRGGRGGARQRRPSVTARARLPVGARRPRGRRADRGWHGRRDARRRPATRGTKITVLSCTVQTVHVEGRALPESNPPTRSDFGEVSALFGAARRGGLPSTRRATGGGRPPAHWPTQRATTARRLQRCCQRPLVQTTCGYPRLDWPPLRRRTVDTVDRACGIHVGRLAGLSILYCTRARGGAVRPPERPPYGTWGSAPVAGPTLRRRAGPTDCATGGGGVVDPRGVRCTPPRWRRRGARAPLLPRALSARATPAIPVGRSH